MPDPIIEKIKFTKEELDLIDKINKREPIKRTRISTNKERHYIYEYTTNKPLTYSVGRRRLLQLYGGICTSCGAWPSYKVLQNVGDKKQGAWLVERYCQKCYDKQENRSSPS